MSSRRRRAVAAAAALAMIPLVAGGTGTANAAPRVAGASFVAAAPVAAPRLAATVAAAPGTVAAPRLVAAVAPAVSAAMAPGYHRFTHPTRITNRFFPLVAGTQFIYDGTVEDDSGNFVRHSVIFTVTGMTKVVNGHRTVVAWDRDFIDGALSEAEVAFFAQDDAGNVWNFGEYPEEFDGTKFAGAPATWIDGQGGHGGIHMLASPLRGTPAYSEGLIPPIQFDDLSKVHRTGLRVCVPARCSYTGVLEIDEWSPPAPQDGHQRKFYAPGVGLIKVVPAGGQTQELLKLVQIRHLGHVELGKADANIVRMEKRAYRVSAVYRTTAPATRRHGL